MKISIAKTLLILPFVCFLINGYSQNSKIFIWSDDLKCLLTQPNLDKDTTDIYVKMVIDNMYDTLKNKAKHIKFKDIDSNGKYREGYKDLEHFICYVGADINSNEKYNSNIKYLKSHVEENQDIEALFFKKTMGEYKIVKWKGSVFQIAEAGSCSVRADTKLANGKWFFYTSSNGRLYLNLELTIRNDFLNGYCEEYNDDGSKLKLSKYRNGIEVDSSFDFDHGRLSGYVIKSEDGQFFLYLATYYPNSDQLLSYIDYWILKYEFTFFPNGKISSMVKLLDGNKTGVKLEFNEKDSIIGKIEFPDYLR